MKAGGHLSSFTPKLSLKSADIGLTYVCICNVQMYEGVGGMYNTPPKYAESVNDIVFLPTYAKIQMFKTAESSTHRSSRKSQAARAASDTYRRCFLQALNLSTSGENEKKTPPTS